MKDIWIVILGIILFMLIEIGVVVWHYTYEDPRTSVQQQIWEERLIFP